MRIQSLQNSLTSLNGSILLGQLRQCGVSAPSIGRLSAPPILEEIARTPELSERFQEAMRRSSEKGGMSLAPAAPASWPAEVTSRFQRVDRMPWGWDDLKGLWRDVRKASGSGEKRWASVLQKKGFGADAGPSEPDSLSQILKWLEIRTVPAGRKISKMDPGLLGFRNSWGEDPLPGDLAVCINPLFSEMGILTAVNAEPKPAGALFVLGARLFTGHPAGLGDFVKLWRLGGPRISYVILPETAAVERSENRLDVLDQLLEVEEAIRFDHPDFHVARQQSGFSLVPGEWLVSFGFDRLDEAILHLQIRNLKDVKVLSVVIDFLGRGNYGRLPDFIRSAEAAAHAAASRLGFNRLDISYKTVVPFDSKGRVKKLLEDSGYVDTNQEAWGRLPGKKIILRNTRR